MRHHNIPIMLAATALSALAGAASGQPASSAWQLDSHSPPGTAGTPRPATVRLFNFTPVPTTTNPALLYFRYLHNYDAAGPFIGIDAPNPGATIPKPSTFPIGGTPAAGVPGPVTTGDSSHFTQCTGTSMWSVSSGTAGPADQTNAGMPYLDLTTRATAAHGSGSLDNPWAFAMTGIYDPTRVANPNPGATWFVGGRVSISGQLDGASGWASLRNNWTIQFGSAAPVALFDILVATANSPGTATNATFAPGLILERDGAPFSAATLLGEIMSGFTPDGHMWNSPGGGGLSGGLWFDWVLPLSANINEVDISDNREVSAYSVPTPGSAMLVGLGIVSVFRRRR